MRGGRQPQLQYPTSLGEDRQANGRQSVQVQGPGTQEQAEGGGRDGMRCRVQEVWCCCIVRIGMLHSTVFVPCCTVPYNCIHLSACATEPGPPFCQLYIMITTFLIIR